MDSLRSAFPCYRFAKESHYPDWSSVERSDLANHPFLESPYFTLLLSAAVLRVDPNLNLTRIRQAAARPSTPVR
jgi:hypothetical protein